jgi:cold-inducible RNA-binding protein
LSATAWPNINLPRLAAHQNNKEKNFLKNIFVGNLDFGATESVVRSWFEPYGTVDRVQVVTDRETGRSRGFAFVEMSDAAQADQAINALNGAEMDGRALNVNEARPKPQGGGGGRSGGGFRREGGGGQRRQSRW